MSVLDQIERSMAMCKLTNRVLRADIRENRLLRKIARRDERIAGMERRISELEHEVSMIGRHRDEVYKAVQEALCNVRMIPARWPMRAAKIAEVREVCDGDRNDSR